MKTRSKIILFILGMGLIVLIILSSAQPVIVKGPKFVEANRATLSVDRKGRTNRIMVIGSELLPLNGYEPLPILWPVENEDGFVISVYGMRPVPGNESEKRMHNGVDITGDRGDTVLSACEGIVSFAGWFDGYGYNVRVTNRLGIETRYAHLDEFFVMLSESLTQGQIIGEMGNSGAPSGQGPHLHFEIRTNGEALDPLGFLGQYRQTVNKWR